MKNRLKEVQEEMKGPKQKETKNTKNRSVVMKKVGFFSSMMALAATAFVLVSCCCWDRDPCCNPCPRPCCPPRPAASHAVLQSHAVHQNHAVHHLRSLLLLRQGFSSTGTCMIKRTRHCLIAYMNETHSVQKFQRNYKF